MNIGIHYRAYEDCTALLYVLTDCTFEIKPGEDTFRIYHEDDVYVFSKNIDIINECDMKIQLFHTFSEWKKFKGYDKLIQTQTVENYHITNAELKEYLDAGNICLSSASISFEHPNFYYDPIFNLIFFYYHYGFNFLNYHKFDNKNNLLGVYHKPVDNINIQKGHRNFLYSKVKEILNEDFVSYESKDYNQKLILQPYTSFGQWGNNHISSYTDYTTSVCNIVFETLYGHANVDSDESDRMYGRQYITEKTLKSICFSEENIFFIWYGPNILFKHLNDMGFWFLNSEYYQRDAEVPQIDSIGMTTPIEHSVIDTAYYLQNLKNKLKTNEKVYEYLIEKYGHRLKQNIILFNQILNSYSKKEQVLKLIKNG